MDWAVGVLLVEEAGGVVTDWWGRGPEVYERTGTVIVANRGDPRLPARAAEGRAAEGAVRQPGCQLALLI